MCFRKIKAYLEVDVEEVLVDVKFRFWEFWMVVVVLKHIWKFLISRGSAVLSQVPTKSRSNSHHLSHYSTQTWEMLFTHASSQLKCH